MSILSNILWNRTALWCSATAMAALLCLQMIHAPRAHADAVQGKSGVSMATIRSGFGVVFTAPSCLWVIDDSSEMLFIYGIEGANDPRLQVRWTQHLPTLFRQARGG